MLSRYEIDGKPVNHLALYKVGDAVVVEYLLPLRINLQKGIFLVMDGKTRFTTPPCFAMPQAPSAMCRPRPSLWLAFSAAPICSLCSPMQGDNRVFSFAYPLASFTATSHDGKAGKPTPAGK
jgi:hypothetical protein